MKMFRLLKGNNVGVEHGRWGEDLAAEFLGYKGYRIIERNSIPCEYDHRLEIDIVAEDMSNGTLVFVEVKQHAKYSPFQCRLRSINANKLANLRQACNAWRRHHHWEGAYRFDVIEIYGTPDDPNPRIDHVDRVRLFANPDRFVCWQ